MLRKIGIILLAVVFIGSIAWAPTVSTVDAAAKCECGKDCKCEHCATGKGECHCKAGDKGCKCKSDDKGCQCGKDCKCEHCKTGKGTCNCKTDGKGGCRCGKDCNCSHCRGKAEQGAASAQEKPTTNADYAKTRVSKTGTFKASYTSDLGAVPVNKLHSWKLRVETDDGKPVKDAEITIEGTMPEYRHGMSTQPKVTKNYGDGTYLVSGMKFSMPGWWVMTFSIKEGGKTDSVTFNLQLK